MHLDIYSFLFVLLLGCISCWSGARMLSRLKRTGENAGVAKAKITSVHVEKGITGPQLFFPEVEFTTNENRTVKQRYPVGTASGKYQEGEEVEVIYKKNDPEDFFIKGGEAASFAMLLLFGGIILVVFAIAKYF